MVRTSVSPGAGLRFKIVEALGSGGFGAVYEAIDARSGQRVALKELDDASAASIARFKQEFRALADCHHPNLVSLKELIEEEGRWYIVMELVPGSDFLKFVRGAAENDNQRYDETRLRGALRSVAEGLFALHGYGILHRDLKPSNIRVTPEGRAVLLDFGLVTSADPKHQSTHAMALGTVPYMAPEQATNSNVGRPADWYACGVCLFEALTGRWPFDDETAFQILTKKQQLDAPRASSLVPSVPADLDELCARLLDRSPETRAGAREVFAVVGWPADASSAALQPAPSGAQVSFAGRDAELLMLRRALARSGDGAFNLVLVEGESGVGKSELVAEFVRTARAEQPKLTVLQGRCYENEQVSYKAFDGCIDELSRFLRRLSSSACGQLLPPRASLLGQLFPVLRAIGPIARAPRGESSADPTARRLEAFDALAALFSKLAEERPLMLVIDDLQWADVESFRLLLALAQRPEPPPMLIVATIRPAEELEPAVAEGLEAFRRTQRIEVVQILGLPLRDASALARALLGPNAPEQYCQMIAEESAGHPLFLSELVQFVRSHDLAARGRLTLEAAVRARIERLDDPSRELLQMAALAGRPYPLHILARAVGRDAVDEQARKLLAAKLLRARKGQEIGCYHDRIRHTVVSLVAKSRIGVLHRQLAQALASDPLSDAQEQARHWDLSGDGERAIEAYERAAEAALAALAFMRVAELCARASELIGGRVDERSQRLLALHARALACAGRSAESAALYAEAIQCSRGDAQYLLRANYAEQLVGSGKLDLGVAAMRSLLSELGIKLPKGNFGTVLQIVALRLWLALRGDNFEMRNARHGEERLVLTAGVLSMFRTVVAPLHPLIMILVSLRSLHWGMKLPLRDNMLGVYTFLGWMRSLQGNARGADAMFEKSRSLAVGSDNAASLASLEYVEGSARLMTWNFERALQCLERAQQLARTKCPDMPAQLRNIRYHLGIALYVLGDHGRLARESEGWIAEARERNDKLSVALLAGMGYGFLRHLMRDAPDHALRELEACMLELPKEPFSFLHYGELCATVNVLLYKRGAAAHEWLESRAAEHARPMILRSAVGRDTLSVYRGTAALHALLTRAPNARAALLKQARKEARHLLRSRGPLMITHGHMLMAQIHGLAGRRDEALAAARSAVGCAPSYKCQPRLLASYLLALLEAATSQCAGCLAITEQLRAEGWVDPDGKLRMMLPAIAQLTPEVARAAERGNLLLRRYEVVRTLGAGGFGAVVEARDVQTGRSIALKELVSDDPRSLERFKHEFRTLADLHHPNLVRLEGLLQDGGSWYIAMELLGGESLLEHTCPLGVADRARICAAFSGVVDGLNALHEAGFAHRDVTPDNVRVTPDGRAVLLDFGLIGRFGDASDKGGVGSVEYAAPEQLEGAGPSSAADVYGLGTCLYRALSGRLPFAGSTPAELFDRKKGVPPAPLHLGALEALESLALQMLAPDPAARPRLAEVRARLHAHVSATPTRPPPSYQADRAEHFSGREAELERLASAYERTCDEGLSVVLVEGESGLGKSALVAEFGRVSTRARPTRLSSAAAATRASRSRSKRSTAPSTSLRARCVRCRVPLARRSCQSAQRCSDSYFPCSTAWRPSPRRPRRASPPTRVRDTVRPLPAS